LFEEFIDISNLKFYVKKISLKKYLAFAYDEKKIITSILNAGLTLKQINKIYFSQVELKNKLIEQNETCVRIDGVCLGLLDDKIVQVPSCLNTIVQNKIDISQLSLSNDNISVNIDSKYVSKDISNKLSIIFTLFTILIFMNIYKKNDVITKITNKIEIIKVNSNIPNSSIQTKSIIKSYKKLYNLQIDIREMLHYTMLVKRVVGATIVSCEYKNKIIKCKFKNTTLKNIKKYFSKKYKINKILQQNKIIFVEFKL
jgi:hypothetical protein